MYIHRLCPAFMSCPATLVKNTHWHFNKILTENSIIFLMNRWWSFFGLFLWFLICTKFIKLLKKLRDMLDDLNEVFIRFTLPKTKEEKLFVNRKSIEIVEHRVKHTFGAERLFSASTIPVRCEIVNVWVWSLLLLLLLLSMVDHCGWLRSCVCLHGVVRNCVYC